MSHHWPIPVSIVVPLRMTILTVGMLGKNDLFHLGILGLLASTYNVVYPSYKAYHSHQSTQNGAYDLQRVVSIFGIGSG